MSRIDFDALEEAWDAVPNKAPIRANGAPTGSLTDNRRIVKSQRDGAIKRLREFKVSVRESA